MLKRLLLSTVVGLFPVSLSAQASCAANLDSLFVRIEANYAGLKVEYTSPQQQAGYQRLKAKFRQDAAKTTDTDCFGLLSRATSAFDDPHLFILQVERLDSAETRRRMAAVQQLQVNETSIRAELSRSRRKLDPIEGIWYDRALRVAVIPEPGKGKNHFVAVVLTSDSVTWKAGDVRARLVRDQYGSYDVTLAMRDHATRQLHGTLHRRVLLRLSPGIWGKEFPIAPGDSGALDPVDAHRATWRSRGETAILAIPSHDPTHASALQAIGEQHGQELASLKYLIVDLRGNEGGSSWVTNELLPFIRSEPARPSHYDIDNSVMLSSPAQIAYARRAFGPDTSAFVRSLVSRLEAAPGTLVPLRDPAAPAEPQAARLLAGQLQRIAVLIDEGTVSASEVLVLEALRSTRAVVIGEPTAGALDYQSVNVVRLSPAEQRWMLGYPTIARSAHLEATSCMRVNGIGPDVYLRWSKQKDEMGKVMGILKK